MTTLSMSRPWPCIYRMRINWRRCSWTWRRVSSSPIVWSVPHTPTPHTHHTTPTPTGGDPRLVHRTSQEIRRDHQTSLHTNAQTHKTTREYPIDCTYSTVEPLYKRPPLGNNIWPLYRGGLYWGVVLYTNCSFGTWVPSRYTEVAFIQGWLL